MARRQEQAERDTSARWSQKDRTAQERDTAGHLMDEEETGWDEDLKEASMQHLQDVADELGIDDYETLSREQLLGMIRRERGAEF